MLHFDTCAIHVIWSFLDNIVYFLFVLEKNSIRTLRFQLLRERVTSSLRCCPELAQAKLQPQKRSCKGYHLQLASIFCRSTIGCIFFYNFSTLSQTFSLSSVFSRSITQIFLYNLFHLLPPPPPPPPNNDTNKAISM